MKARQLSRALCLATLLAVSPGLNALADEPGRDAADEIANAAGKLPKALGQCLSPSTNCKHEGEESVLEREYGPPLEDAEKTWTTTSCDILLSPNPPLMIAIGSTVAGIAIDPWYPVCSIAMMNESRKSLAEKKANDGPVEVAKDVRRRTLEYDSCTKPTSEMRDGPGYVPPTQEAYGAKQMSKHERTEYYSQVLATRNKVRDICCAGEKTCSDLMDKVAINFCKPQSDPKKPEPCTENGTQYDNSDDAKDKMTKAMQDKTPKQLKGKFPLDAGYVQLSPLADDDGHPVDDLSTVAHEFTHGCSMIRRELDVNAGDADTQAELLSSMFQDSETAESGPGCKITPETERVYNRLFNKLNARLETFHCLEDVARTGADTRFPPALPCYQGCPRSHLEESLAMWMQLETPLPKDLKPLIYKSMCGTERDNQHPLGLDIIKCALLTPQLVDLTKEGLQCKP